MTALTVAEIARICNGAIRGDGSRMIRRANTLESAAPDEIAFSVNTKSDVLAQRSRAGCLIVSTAFDSAGDWSLIQVENPRIAFAQALAILYEKRPHNAGIHPTAVIAETARLGNECFVGPHAVIGEFSEIGDSCFIGAGVSIGDRVVIGAQSTLHPQTAIYDDVKIGSRVILHAGAVIGADGFGFSLQRDRYEKFPQVGTVDIEDDVEIGANTCIDRAALGVTRIGTGTKLDNLVHIAHNCVLGKHVVIAAQTGLSGSTVIGDYAVIGGQVGMGDRVSIDSKAVVGSKSGILPGQRVKAGEPVWGIPARPLRQHLKGLANVGKIPELKEELRELKRKISALQTSDVN